MTTGFRSLPTPSMREREQMDEDGLDSMNTVNTQVTLDRRVGGKNNWDKGRLLPDRVSSYQFQC